MWSQRLRDENMRYLIVACRCEHGYRLSVDISGYHWISLDISGCQWISADSAGYWSIAADKDSSGSFAGQ